MRTAVIVIDGVLRPTINSDGIDPIGRELFYSLKQGFRIVLLDDSDHKDTEHWLGVYGLTGWVRLVRGSYLMHTMPAPDRRLLLLSRIRNSDGADFVVESDAASATKEIESGYTVMFYARPEYMLDIWDPSRTKEPRPWDQVVGEIDRQRAAKSRDIRLKEQDD